MQTSSCGSTPTTRSDRLRAYRDLIREYRRTRPFLRGWGRIPLSEFRTLSARQQAGYLLINNRGSVSRALRDLESLIYVGPWARPFFIAGLDVYKPTVRRVLLDLTDSPTGDA